MTTTTDYRAALAELLTAIENHVDPGIVVDGIKFDAIRDRARALLAAPEAVGVALSDPELNAMAFRFGQPCYPFDHLGYAHAILARLSRYGSAHPAPIPASERLPELRGMFERILSKARCMETRTVGNIELADRLLDAVVDWALPLPGPAR